MWFTFISLMKISTFFTHFDFSMSLLWQHNFLLLVFAFVNYWVMLVAGNGWMCFAESLDLYQLIPQKKKLLHSTFIVISFNLKCVLSTLYEFLIMQYFVSPTREVLLKIREKWPGDSLDWKKLEWHWVIGTVSETSVLGQKVGYILYMHYFQAL